MNVKNILAAIKDIMLLIIMIAITALLLVILFIQVSVKMIIAFPLIAIGVISYKGMQKYS